jgi:xanthine dehydrogenase large subunit
MGQGLFTKIHQIAAQSLGVTLDRVRLMATRTDKVPNTSATAASAGTDLNGAAVVDACAQLTATLATVAAGLLGCAVSDVRFAANTVSNIASGGGQTLPFAAVCEAAYMQRRPLFAQGFYRTPGIHFDAATGQGKPFHYFAYGAAASEVEIDGFTGDYRVVRTDILQDVGDSVSPIVDRGQIEGGFIQGVGWLTIEELVWDAEGRVATGGASTYKLPSWSELPETFEVNCLERATQPGVVFGSKAVGEPPLMLAISVREAIRDAVAAFSHDSSHDRRHDTLSPTAPVTFASPATPERVYFAVAHARAARPALK